MQGVRWKMSLKPGPIQPVPEETSRVVGAAFPKGNLYLALRNKLGPIFDDEDFVGLFPKDGQPGLPPWRPSYSFGRTFLTARPLRPSEPA